MDPLNPTLSSTQVVVGGGGMLVGRLILGESVGEGRLECESETEKAGGWEGVRG